MSDGPLEALAEGPPSKKPTPWSVRKIVEQVTGRPLESMQDPPGTRRAPRSAAAEPPRGPPLERYHQEIEQGGQIALLASPEEERAPLRSTSRNATLDTLDEDRSPSLKAFLPGTGISTGAARSGGRSPSLPLGRTLPPEVVEEVERLRAEEGQAPLSHGDASHPHHRSELERVYLSYLLMHLDKLTEPALKYLRHAVEEECEERGLPR